MHTYSCSGTLGDTYINLCILYNFAIKEAVLCKHYTLVLQWHSLIEQIYSLLPNIRVEFVSERATSHPRIHSAFSHQEKHGDEFARPDEWCVFPEFVFPKTEIELPDRYTVLNPQSGKPKENRHIEGKSIHEILKTSVDPVVVIGTGKKHKDILGSNVINIVGRTSLLEAMSIVSKASYFCGFQGLMSFVAMSHCVQSDVYARSESDIQAISARMPEQWKQYCSIVRD